MPRRRLPVGYEHAPGNIEKLRRRIRIVDDNPPVSDLPARFKGIARRGTHLAAFDGRLFPGWRYGHYTYNNHFQGIQRLRNSRYVVASGGDPGTRDSDRPNAPTAHLFVMAMDSLTPTGFWRSNLKPDGVPLKSDRVVKTIALDSDLWHAGGIHRLGNILAVPIEEVKGQASRILFLHMSDPMNPKLFNHEIVRTDGKAGSAALAKLPNGRFLCGAWSDSDNVWTDDSSKAPRLDLYLSRSDNFHDGFDQDHVVSLYDADVRPARGQPPGFHKYQGIAFVRPAEPARANKLYLIGLGNRAAAAPLVGGEDRADLFELTLPASLLRPSSQSPGLTRPVIRKLAGRRFTCEQQRANFNAAAGVQVMESTGALALYSAYHWRVRPPGAYSHSVIPFTEFRQCPPIDRLADAWIELFEHRNFEGRRHTIYGRTGTRLRDYGRLLVEGMPFNDTVESIRCQLPPGVRYRLFTDKRYKDEGPRSHRDLVGDGTVQQIPDLAASPWRFANTISSSRYAT